MRIRVQEAFLKANLCGSGPKTVVLDRVLQEPRVLYSYKYMIINVKTTAVYMYCSLKKSGFLLGLREV